MSATRRYIPDIPPDSADGRSSFVHTALIITGRMGMIHPLALLPVFGVLAFAAGWPWRVFGLVPALGGVIFVAVDWAMLGLLPVARRSWGPVTPPLLALAVLRLALSWIVAWVASNSTGLIVLTSFQTLISAVAIYATWIEPFALDVTRRTYSPAGWCGSTPLHVLHISDIHFEGLSPRENALLATVVDFQPDLILLTGDYLNLSSVYDAGAQAGVRELLAQFHAPLGIFAVTGSPVVDVEGIVPGIFEGLPVTWLRDEAVSVALDGGSLTILGVTTTYDEVRDTAALTRLARDVPDGSFTVLLYHTPDLFPTAAALGVDLYLCGHTHGGQIRLPMYGALATSSRWGKRYEMGLYREGSSVLYVSRGLGMEGLGAPRARLLAPPEVVMWTLVSNGH